MDRHTDLSCIISVMICVSRNPVCMCMTGCVEMQKLEQDGSDSYLDSEWADSRHLKRQFQGLTNIQFQPGKKL